MYSTFTDSTTNTNTDIGTPHVIINSLSEKEIVNATNDVHVTVEGKFVRYAEDKHYPVPENEF